MRGRTTRRSRWSVWTSSRCSWSRIRTSRWRRPRDLMDRIEFCYTPKHGRWLNIPEHELSAVTRQCLSGRRIGDFGTVRDEIAAWSVDMNTRQRSVGWCMKADDGRWKIESVYPKIKALQSTSRGLRSSRNLPLGVGGLMKQ